MTSLMDVAQETIRVAINNPAATTPTAQYMSQGAPICLLGHALYNTGVIDHRFESTPYNHKSLSWVFYSAEARDFFAKRGLVIPSYAANTIAGRFLAWIQPLTDNGAAWRESACTATYYAIKTMNDESRLDGSRLLDLL